MIDGHNSYINIACQLTSAIEIYNIRKCVGIKVRIDSVGKNVPNETFVKPQLL